jgi:hypothetical protein
VHPDIPPIVLDDSTPPLSISPTDVSQFIRLDQCQRYLRLRLHSHLRSDRFLADYDVQAQPIPPILTLSGAVFEAEVERTVRLLYPVTTFGNKDPDASDNDAIVELAQELGPGETHVVFQPRLEATLGHWRIRGDVDLIRLERDAAGELRLLIADMKSSNAAKVEHRLQVAFYHEMLTAILAGAGVAHEPIDLAILYRGPAIPATTPELVELHAAQSARAAALLGGGPGLLEEIDDKAGYIDAVHDLVIGERSLARRTLATPFASLPFSLTMKCDGCLFNEFCMKEVAESDDLSLLPLITEGDKGALIRNGVTTTARLASLKDIRRHGTVQVDGETQPNIVLTPAPGEEALASALASTWPVGPRLDELIHRAKRYRNSKDQAVEAISWIPGKGYGSLPYSDADHNPNLVRIYIDAQHDYLHDRVYLLGALVVANEGGEPRPERRQAVVRMTDRLPHVHVDEENLLREWVSAVLAALADVTAPDENGEMRAPIHLVFFNRFAQQKLLDALARHATSILGATALYDFVTQIAAFDSPLVSYLEQHIQQFHNYPMVCQSLQSVAQFLKFDWRPYRQLFYTQMFDHIGVLKPEEGAVVPGEENWITSRARFNSQIPLEYAYAAWEELPPPAPGKRDEFGGYRAVTRDVLEGFQTRRLEAMEHIANTFKGNKQSTLTPFLLPDLSAFRQKAPSMAHALDEFVTIERHVEMADWRNARHAAPEQRMLAGHTLIVTYHEDDQEPGVAERNRDNAERRRLKERQRAEYRASHPDAARVLLSKEQKAESDWSQDDIVFRLRIETTDIGCDLHEALSRSAIKENARLVIMPRLTFDSRLPGADQRLFTPTPRQIPYGMRADLRRIEVERQDGRAVRAWAHVTLGESRGGRGGPRGFVFDTIGDNYGPLEPGETYTLDPDPNSWTGMWAALVSQGLIAGGENPMYSVLAGKERLEPGWPSTFVAGQQRFLDGLDALEAAGAMHGFEDSKREFIGGHTNTGVLLVQGPPGTGKSYSTAFAILARFQGALAAGVDFRVFLSCKTHAATDVLIENMADVQAKLATFADRHAEIFDEWFDRRLLDIPLFRFRERKAYPGVIPVAKDRDKEKGAPRAWQRFAAERWCVVAATPGGIYGLVKDEHKKDGIFGHTLAHCLVLDEASQMNLPEAVMAALPLAPDGNVIVVGDHRQMPPIVKNDWAAERRRSFSEFRSYESLFLTLLQQQPPKINFEESFRLHADMAEFLRREIYVHDGIDYHSNRREVIAAEPFGDTFLAAVLAPEHPLTVVIHDEASSQQANAFEERLMAPILAALAEPTGLNLGPGKGLGVVVPHRAQRASLIDNVRAVSIRNDVDEVEVSAVDTVERFQGRERDVMLFGATESDREYLLVAGGFLLDPRRLNVALSRAKQKMILIAARSVFELFSADEETFQNAQLWKNLLRHTCTELLWEGERHDVHVEVWGNPVTSAI